MKAKKPAPSRRRISFAVNRDEVEVNSDWVEAVMASPTRPAGSPLTNTPPVVPLTAQPKEVPLSSGPAPQPAQVDGGPEDVFFALDHNPATGAEIASGEECRSVEITAAVEEEAPVVNDATVAEIDVVAQDLQAQNPSLVAKLATGALSSTAELPAPHKRKRIPRLRPIVRVTDGLTPGQYAVYSLMYEAGESAGDSSRIYRGGYADLGRLTGLSKRGLQNILGELQAKQVIRIHQKPGYQRSETSAYVVPDRQTVVENWFSRGWRHVFGKSKTFTS